MSKKVSKKLSNKTKEPTKETETVYATKPITEENICWVIKEIGKDASVNSIRKHLGQPVFLQFTPKPVWAADQIRAILTTLVKSGKVVKAGEKTQVYTIK